MEQYIGNNNLNDITYLSELTPPTAGLIRPAKGGTH